MIPVIPVSMSSVINKNEFPFGPNSVWPKPTQNCHMIAECGPINCSHGIPCPAAMLNKGACDIIDLIIVTQGLV